MENNVIDFSNLKSYLEYHNIDTSKFFHCINPDHIDRNPSMRYYDDNRVYCFGCHKTYDLVGVMSILENKTYSEAYKEAIEKYGLRQGNQSYKRNINKDENAPKNYDNAFKIWHNNINNRLARDYLKKRCISDKTARKFNLGFNSFDFGNYKFNSIVIPINSNSFTARNVSENTNEIRYYKPKGCHSDIFNSSALTNQYPYCFIAEGEFDCMSFDTVGINAIALSSANNIEKFIDKEKDCSKTYILALDNDDVGKMATTELIDYFIKNNIKYLTFGNCGMKDANQALVANKDNFVKAIEKVLENLDKENYRKLKKLQNAEM